MQDIIVYNGMISDGTGSDLYPGGVAVKDGMITYVGDVSLLTAEKMIDARGHVIAPGFIDAHCHSDVSFIADDRSQSRIYQGITTEVCGQCGDSYFPCLAENISNISTKNELTNDEEWADVSFNGFLSHVKRSGKAMSTNLCQLTGHGALRAGVMGYDDRAPSGQELSLMCELLDRSLCDGSWGLSLGLEYTPGCFADIHELCALAKVVKKHGGIVTAHMRDEGQVIFDAVREIIEIGRKTGVKVHISHLKIDRPVNWGNADKVWKLITDAKERGVNISADVYPYDASCTGITNRCPKWSIEGGVESAAAFLKSTRRQEIIDHLAGRFPDEDWAKRCLISSTNGRLSGVEGKTLYDVASRWGVSYAEAAARLIIETDGHTDCIFFTMDEKDLDFFLKQDVGIGSDGKGHPFDPSLLGNEKPHPRYYGAFVRFLRLARENSICTTAEAVRRITSKAADMLGLTDRGRLIEGLAADITVFDPDTVSDTSTYLDPFQKPVGIDHVIVNGKLALYCGEQTNERSGKYILK